MFNFLLKIIIVATIIIKWIKIDGDWRARAHLFYELTKPSMEHHHRLYLYVYLFIH